VPFAKMLPRMSSSRVSSFREWSDDALLAECRIEKFRGPGPGGQKRNKSSSSVRITHVPSAISASAGESRSQERNRQMAINRLRHRMALKVREAVVPSRWPNPAVVEVSRRTRTYYTVMGMILDTLKYSNWSISDTAKLIGLSTGQLVAFLREDPQLWTEVNNQRKQAGLRGLNS
jgi:hypothetical protein